jgi:hypothetical protein
MTNTYEILVNGQVVNKVQGREGTTLAEFVAFQRTVTPDIDESTVTVRECTAKIIPFRTDAYMQVAPFAIELHLKNLISTYGEELVWDIVRKLAA